MGGGLEQPCEAMEGTAIATKLSLYQGSESSNSDKPNPPFLVYPDEKSKHMGVVYEPFATRVIEQGMNYG